MARFPYLKVRDWMPILLEHYHLEVKLESSDDRYWMVHNLCKNARTRIKNKKLKTQVAVGVEPAVQEEHPPGVVELQIDVPVMSESVDIIPSGVVQLGLDRMAADVLAR